MHDDSRQLVSVLELDSEIAPVELPAEISVHSPVILLRWELKSYWRREEYTDIMLVSSHESSRTQCEHIKRELWETLMKGKIAFAME